MLIANGGAGLEPCTNMITEELRNQVDRIWDAFWSGGISNPLEVIEQITYLLFLRRLDELQTLEETKARTLGQEAVERRIFPAGKDKHGRSYDDYRWSKFKDFEARDLYQLVGEHIFPFLRTLGGDDSTYATHMKDARFTIPTPALLVKVVDMIAALPMEGVTPRAISMSTCSRRSPVLGRTGNFARPATSFSSWLK